MKIRPLTSNIAMKLPGRLKKISKRLRLDLSSRGELESAIILGDGTPDDIVVAIVCYHLNGDKIAGLIKPERITGPSVVELIPKTYLKMKIGKFAVVVDQELDYPTVEKLFMNVEKREEIIVDWINNYCDTTSFEPKSLVVGISGGIDSSVVSTLCALTKRKTIVLSMPIKQIKSQHDLSIEHANWLMSKFKNVPFVRMTVLP
jgi:hypothetical protein